MKLAKAIVLFFGLVALIVICVRDDERRAQPAAAKPAPPPPSPEPEPITADDPRCGPPPKVHPWDGELVAPDGSYEGGVEVFIRKNTGDRVDVENCTKPVLMEDDKCWVSVCELSGDRPQQQGELVFSYGPRGWRVVRE